MAPDGPSPRGRRWVGVAWARVPPAVDTADAADPHADADRAGDVRVVTAAEDRAAPGPDRAEPEPQPETGSSPVPEAADGAPGVPGVRAEPSEPDEPAGPSGPLVPPRRAPVPPKVADRPHVRLGILWAVILTVAVLIGPAGIAVVLAAASALAAIDVARAHQVRPPWRAVAAAAAAALVLVALARPAGLVAGAAVAVLTLAATGVRARRSGDEGSRAEPWWCAAGAAIALAPACVVFLAGRSLVATGVLLVAACLYDAGSFLVGAGAVNRWEGPAAGVLALVPFVVIVASAFDPPFRHGSGWMAGAVLLLLAPLGPVLANRLVGTARAAAVRRLDVLLLVAPAWAVLATMMDVH